MTAHNLSRKRTPEAPMGEPAVARSDRRHRVCRGDAGELGCAGVRVRVPLHRRGETKPHDVSHATIGLAVHPRDRGSGSRRRGVRRPSRLPGRRRRGSG